MLMLSTELIKYLFKDFYQPKVSSKTSSCIWNPPLSITGNTKLARYKFRIA